MYPRFSPDAVTPWKGPTGGGRASDPDEVPGGVGLLPQEHCHTHKCIVSNLQHKLQSRLHLPSYLQQLYSQ